MELLIITFVVAAGALWFAYSFWHALVFAVVIIGAFWLYAKTADGAGWR